MRVAVWAAMLTLVYSAAWAGTAPAAPPPGQPKVPAAVVNGMADFERNAALGLALTMRAGTPAEIAELRGLAERGLAAAREATARYPEAPEASYLLASWLIYGYRVVEVRRVVTDAQGVEHAELANRVLQGLGDDCDEGLAALKRASVLAPGQGKYLVEYGAALFDCDRPLEALESLKATWFGQPQLTVAEKMQTAVLLSRVYTSQGLLREAREWAYSALGVNPQNADAVQELRELDAAEAAAQQAAPSETGPGEESAEGGAGASGPEAEAGAGEGAAGTPTEEMAPSEEAPLEEENPQQ